MKFLWAVPITGTAVHIRWHQQWWWQQWWHQWWWQWHTMDKSWLHRLIDMYAKWAKNFTLGGGAMSYQPCEICRISWNPPDFATKDHLPGMVKPMLICCFSSVTLNLLLFYRSTSFLTTRNRIPSLQVCQQKRCYSSLPEHFKITLPALSPTMEMGNVHWNNIYRVHYSPHVLTRFFRRVINMQNVINFFFFSYTSLDVSICCVILTAKCVISVFLN